MPDPSELMAATERRIASLSGVAAFPVAGLDLGGFRPRDDFEASIDWFDLLQRHVFTDDPGIRYYAATDGTRLDAILPLRLCPNGSVRKIEAMGNYYTSLFTPLLADAGKLSELRGLLSAALKDNPGAHVMRFAPMDPDAPAFKTLLADIHSLGWVPFSFFCFRNWYLRVIDDWDGYLKRRSGNLRSSIKRRSKRFAAEGGELEVITSPDGVEQAIEVFQEVYSASWKVPEPYPSFVPALIRHLASVGMLRLGIARLAGAPVAAQLWIVGQGKASIYKVAYHEKYSSFSPGTVLTSHLLQHVIEKDRVKEVDFLIGDDEYKRIWMSDFRDRWGIIAYNPRTVVGVALLLRELAGRTARQTGRWVGRFLDSGRRIGRGIDNDKRTSCNKGRQRADMTWEIVPASRFSEYARQWDELVRSRPGTPFLESAFLLPAIETFGSGSEKLCLIRVNGKLRAGAIMQRRPKGIWQTFQPSQLPLGAWVADKGMDLMRICDELVRRLPGMTLGIGVSQLDPRIQRRPEDGPKIRSQDYIQTAWVDIDRDFETYWEERGKNLKQNMRKQRNKLGSESIETRIEMVTAAADVAKAVADYGLLESSGWKAADGTAIHPDNDQGRFYRKMLENFCALGRGRIYRYWFGDKVVAMDLCIHDPEAIVILKTAYDESFKSVSPSTLMRQEQFQQLFAEKQFARIEFFGKVMEWHTRWTQQSRSLFHVTAYRWAWLRQLHVRVAAPSPTQPEEQASSA